MMKTRTIMEGSVCGDVTRNESERGKDVRFWLVGNYRDDGRIEIMGLFSSEWGAVAAAIGEKNWVGPLVVDRRLPQELTEWPGLWYPNLEDNPRL